MKMHGLAPPLVIPALIALEQRGGDEHAVTIRLPQAPYDALSRDGASVSEVRERASRPVVEAVRR